MEPTFDATREGTVLNVVEGVAAFDPVTLLLAAKKGASENIQVRLRPELELPDTLVTVPAEDLQYQAPVGGVEIPEYPGSAVQQRFAAALDEHGARVIVETFMTTGAAPVNLPPIYEFGSKGPVLVWFTEPDCATPFSIMYTTSSAWPAEDDDIDLDSVMLPS